jgi:hypothetical protein
MLFQPLLLCGLDLCAALLMPFEGFRANLFDAFLCSVSGWLFPTLDSRCGFG